MPKGVGSMVRKRFRELLLLMAVLLHVWSELYNARDESKSYER